MTCIFYLIIKVKKYNIIYTEKFRHKEWGIETERDILILDIENLTYLFLSYLWNITDFAIFFYIFPF